MSTAILSIDLQNDFLKEGFPFAKKAHNVDHLIKDCRTLIDWSRIQPQPYHVIWIISNYKTGTSPDLAHLTHTGRRHCCIVNTEGAEIYKDIVPCINKEKDLTIIKTHFDAFHETSLHQELQLRGVTEILILGVHTNVCVLKTTQAALKLGYATRVVSNCTSTATLKTHHEALEQVPHVTSYAVMKMYGAGDTTLVPKIMSLPKFQIEKCINNSAITSQDYEISQCTTQEEYEAYLYRKLYYEIPWTTMQHRTGVVPRLVSTLVDQIHPIIPIYRHPADILPTSIPFTPFLDQIRKELEQLTGLKLNHCLAQLYLSGDSEIKEHSDKTIDVLRNSSIINYSLGAVRTMTLRCKKTGYLQRIPLPSNSAFIMGLQTNADYMHMINREQSYTQSNGSENSIGPRISLTFRSITTYIDPLMNVLRGQGAGPAGKMFVCSHDNQKQTELKDQLIQAFSNENKQTFDEFDWDANYGKGSSYIFQGPPVWRNEVVYITNNDYTIPRPNVYCLIPLKSASKNDGRDDNTASEYARIEDFQIIHSYQMNNTFNHPFQPILVKDGNYNAYHKWVHNKTVILALETKTYDQYGLWDHSNLHALRVYRDYPELSLLDVQQHNAALPTLYAVNGSIPTMRVLMTLFEKNIDFNYKRLRVMTRPKQTKSPAFLNLNPLGLTPTWITPQGNPINESLSIMRYLECAYPKTKRLLPDITDTWIYPKVTSRMDESESLVKLYDPLEIAFDVNYQSKITQQDKDRLQEVYKTLDYWNMILGHMTYVAGPQFTMGDCAFYPVLYYLVYRGLDLTESQYHHLGRYYNLIRQRESAKLMVPLYWSRERTLSGMSNITENHHRGRVNILARIATSSLVQNE
jgi:nicotinamidase-related amidase/glutathione S-transferase